VPRPSHQIKVAAVASHWKGVLGDLNGPGFDRHIFAPEADLLPIRVNC